MNIPADVGSALQCWRYSLATSTKKSGLNFTKYSYLVHYILIYQLILAGR